MAFKDYILSQGGIRTLKALTLTPPAPEAMDEAPYRSMLNTPVWTNLQFPKGSYTNDDGETINYPDETGETLRIDQVLLSVSQAKNIVTTAVNGRIGTIKEYISLNDYVINVRGALTGDGPTVYPKRDVERLIKILNAPVAIDLFSGFLNRFGISRAVINSFEVPEREGFRNWQGFTISMISDEPVELTIKREENI